MTTRFNPSRRKTPKLEASREPTDSPGGRRHCWLLASGRLPWGAWALAGVFSASGLVSASPVAQSERQSLAPGLTHVTTLRGSVSERTLYRALVGTFDSMVDADMMLERLESANIPAAPHYAAGRYYLCVNELPDRESAEALVEQLNGAGFSEPIAIQEYGQDVTNPDGPWEIHVLEADPRLVHVAVAHAYDAVIGLETTSMLARRRGALAAINGGYFLRRGTYRGDSYGVVQIDGSLLSEPDRGRAATGFFEEDGATRTVFGRLTIRSLIRLASGETIGVSGVNRRRGAKEIIVYTPEFHRTTLTQPNGAEIIVKNNEIAAVHVMTGSSVIPPSGYVISMSSEPARQWLPSFRVGENILVDMILVPLLPDPQGMWPRTEFILGGGPLLLLDGKRYEEPRTESISRVFFLARHPRTAVGVRADGSMLFVTVDGRRPEKSIGMSLRELTDLFVELGAVSAINLDGGGSTTMVVKNRLANSPSDPTGERETANAILLFSRKKP